MTGIGPRARTLPRKGLHMRRIATLAVVASALAVSPANALAVTNTVSLTARMQMLFAPSATAPAPLNYEAVSNVDTSPPGDLPNATGAVELFFAKQIESNAQYFPSCTLAQLDGQEKVPLSCAPAVVGNGFSV